MFYFNVYFLLCSLIQARAFSSRCSRDSPITSVSRPGDEPFPILQQVVHLCLLVCSVSSLQVCMFLSTPLQLRSLLLLQQDILSLFLPVLSPYFSVFNFHPTYFRWKDTNVLFPSFLWKFFFSENNVVMRVERTSESVLVNPPLVYDVKSQIKSW